MMYDERQALLGWLIVRAVPAPNVFRRGLPWQTPFDRLPSLPHESWGRRLHTFLNDRGLGFLPKYEHHDALHVLLGYDTSVVGELRQQAFLVGNGTRTVAGWGLYYLGATLLPEHREQMAKEYARGVASPPIKLARHRSCLA